MVTGDRAELERTYKEARRALLAALRAERGEPVPPVPEKPPVRLEEVVDDLIYRLAGVLLDDRHGKTLDLIGENLDALSVRRRERLAAALSALARRAEFYAGEIGPGEQR